MHRRAFTIIELAIVLTIIGILTGVGAPQYVKSRSVARQASCANNRLTLDGIKQVAMIERGLAPWDEMDVDDLVPEYLTIMPGCDDGGAYSLNGLGEPSRCSIHGYGSGDRQIDRIDDGGSPSLTLN